MKHSMKYIKLVKIKTNVTKAYDSLVDWWESRCGQPGECTQFAVSLQYTQA